MLFNKTRWYNIQILDILWKFMIFFENSGYFMKFLDILWEFEIFCENSGYFVKILDILWKFWIFCENSGYFVKILDILWKFWIFCEIAQWRRLILDQPRTSPMLTQPVYGSTLGSLQQHIFNVNITINKHVLRVSLKIILKLKINAFSKKKNSFHYIKVLDWWSFVYSEI